jgi:hypothetical protein
MVDVKQEELPLEEKKVEAKPKEAPMGAAKKLEVKVFKTKKPKAKPKAKSNVTSMKLCRSCDKARVKTPRAMYCTPCYDVRRDKQLKKGGNTWKARRAKGKAKHHLMYKGKPTAWAVENKTAARKVVKQYTTPGQAQKVLKVLSKAGI